jgi:hypothetical protein
MRRVLAQFLLLSGCAQIAGIEDYSASNPKQAERSSVAAFLGGGTCTACVNQWCGAAIDACAAESSCASPAQCMGRCQDPKCVLTSPACRGAMLPTGHLRGLTDCAKSRCGGECEIGRSWDCVGQYDWSPVLREPVDLSFGFEIFGTNEYLTGAAIQICSARDPINGPIPVSCTQSSELARGLTDERGRISLHLTPSLFLGGPGYPPVFVSVAPTSSKPGQSFPTLAHRVDIGAPVRVFTETFQFPIIAHGKLNEGRFLSGIVLDCRGSRVMAGHGLKISLEGATIGFVGYWGENNEFCVDLDGAECATDFSGTFTINITGDLHGSYALVVEEPRTQRRFEYPVAIPDEPNSQVGVLLFPPSFEDSPP